MTWLCTNWKNSGDSTRFRCSGVSQHKGFSHASKGGISSVTQPGRGSWTVMPSKVDEPIVLEDAQFHVGDLGLAEGG